MISKVAIELLNEPVLFIERQADAGDLLVGWNRARKMRIFRPDGTPLAYFYEEIDGDTKTPSRREDRAFKIMVFNNQNEHILTITRQVQTVTTLVQCYTAHNFLIGEIRQKWHLWRRKYAILHKSCANYGGSEDRLCPDDICSHMSEFGSIVLKPLSSSFEVTKKNKSNDRICMITRCWSGPGESFLSSSGCYAINFEPQDNCHKLEVSHRAMLMSAAASIDNDLFSRDANHFNRKRRSGIRTFS